MPHSWEATAGIDHRRAWVVPAPRFYQSTPRPPPAPPAFSLTHGGQDVRLIRVADGAPLGPPLKVDNPNEIDDLLLEYTRTEGKAMRMAVSVDASTVALALKSGVWFFEVVTGQPRELPTKLLSKVTAFEVSPGGDRLFVGCEDGSGRVWDLKSGKLMGVYHGTRSIYCAAFSPDGSSVLTGLYGGEAWLWDAESGLVIDRPLRLNNPTGMITRVEFRNRAGPANRPIVHVALINEEGVTTCWRIFPDAGGPSERLVLSVETLLHQELSAGETPRPLEMFEVESRRKRLQKLGGPPFQEDSLVERVQLR